jgi:hypothetical protein
MGGKSPVVTARDLSVCGFRRGQLGIPKVGNRSVVPQSWFSAGVTTPGKFGYPPPAASLCAYAIAMLMPLVEYREQLSQSTQSPLICVGDPRKGGSVGCFIVVRSHFRSVLRAVDRKSGSRWSARSAARTNDLEADEDPPHTGSARSEAKTARFKSCDASASAEGLREQVVACRRPALSGSTDEGPAT